MKKFFTIMLTINLLYLSSYAFDPFEFTEEGEGIVVEQREFDPFEFTEEGEEIVVEQREFDPLEFTEEGEGIIFEEYSNFQEVVIQSDTDLEESQSTNWIIVISIVSIILIVLIGLLLLYSLHYYRKKRENSILEGNNSTFEVNSFSNYEQK